MSDYIGTSTSETIANKSKQTFIEDFSEQLIPFVAKYPYSCFDVYEKNKMPNKLYQTIIEKNNSLAIRDLFLNQSEYLDKGEVLSLLQKMEEPFNQLNGEENTKFPFDSHTKTVA